MFFYIPWVILSVVVANLGDSKTIGYWGSLLISLFFSPIIGLLFVIASSDKAKRIGLHAPAIKLDYLKANYINELKELAKLRDEGVITQEEFEIKKAEILNRK